MRHMLHTRQIKSFDFALVLEADFLTGVFRELKTSGKSLIELPRVKIIKNITPLAYDSKHMAVQKFQNLLINIF